MRRTIMQGLTRPKAFQQSDIIYIPKCLLKFK